MTNWTDEQKEAINKSGSNIIVSAGAGSGKTAVLTERVITKLKNGVHLNQLLILTFTNNAAREMKTRIKKAISKDENIKDELKYIDNAEITTFDAYTLSLVKRYHHYLKIDKEIGIIDESVINLQKKKIVNEIFNNYYLNKETNFLNFINTFANKNDKSIRKTILGILKQTDLIINEEEYLNNYIENYFSEQNINNLFLTFEKMIIKRLNLIKNLVDSLITETEDKYNLILQEKFKYLLNSSNYSEVRRNLNIDIPRLPNGSSENAKVIKKMITEELKKLSLTGFESKENLLNDLMETKQFQNTIIDIIINIMKRIKEYKQKINLYEFNDISKIAIQFLKDSPSIANDIKNKYHEIMIDEYQDTSDIQETFINLIQNNNVYMVGDIKQSIYRFRNANPDIFKNKYDLYSKNNSGIKIDLNKNFRSRKGVLDNINDIFDFIMDDDIGNANYKFSHQMIFGNKNYAANDENNFEIYNYISSNEYQKDEIEAFIIGNDIKSKIKNNYQVSEDGVLRPSTYKDFCILMDRTKSFDIYKKVFTHLQIPLNIFKDDDILFTDETSILNNILSFIIKIKNRANIDYLRFYYASIARSYLFRLGDQEIYDVITLSLIKDTLIYQKCYELSSSLDTISNRHFLELIINSFNFYEKFITVGNVTQRSTVIHYILNKAEELNKIGIDIYGLNEYFNSLIEDESQVKLPAIISDSDSVTITNIHKSKGLEYNICYYSGIYREFYLSELTERIIFNNKLGIIIPSFKEGFKKTFIHYINSVQTLQEEISEKIRLFYVALTRAREKVIVIASLNKEKRISINEGIVDYFERINYKSFNGFLESIYPVIEKNIVDTPIPNIDKKYKDKNSLDLNLLYDKENILTVTEKEYVFDNKIKKTVSKTNYNLKDIGEQEKLSFGNKLHNMLEMLDFINPNYSLLGDQEKEIVKNMLTHPIMSNLKTAKMYKEFAFNYSFENTNTIGVIDLMLEYENHIDIIDYKLKNISDKAYIEQLKSYKDYIKTKTTKDINIYLYSLLDKKLIKLD